MAKHGDPLTLTEQHVFGHDAKRHDVIPDLILEQGSGAHDPHTQALMYLKTSHAPIPSWRRPGGAN
jgi:hypothetical protein